MPTGPASACWAVLRWSNCRPPAGACYRGAGACGAPDVTTHLVKTRKRTRRSGRAPGPPASRARTRRRSRRGRGRGEAGAAPPMAGIQEPLKGHTRFKKIKDLNEGTFGFVQLCIDMKTGEQVCLLPGGMTASRAVQHSRALHYQSSSGRCQSPQQHALHLLGMADAQPAGAQPAGMRRWPSSSWSVGLG